MQPHERKAALGHGAVTSLHGETGLSTGFISEVINGKAAPTPAARKLAVKIARKMRTPVRQAFPEYYAKAS